jgi:DNA-binding GntR family transcriptional regulator
MLNATASPGSSAQPRIVCASRSDSTSGTSSNVPSGAVDVVKSTLAALRAGDEEQVAAAMDAHLALLERISEDVAGRSFRRRTPLA